MQEAVGPYRLLRLMDSDGSATVYEAAERDGEARLMLTVLPPSASSMSEAAHESLRAEVLAVAQIRHPNIAAPRVFGRDGPSVFVAAPLVEGETLARYTARAGRLPPLQGLALIAQLLGALACAERHGWVHSALHPGHLLVARNGQLKVNGSAWVAAACGRRPGAFDSPPHLAPEVGTGAPPDQRADLYSAAVIAWQLLTGELPCEPDGSPGNPGRAGVRPVRSVRSGLPAELDDVFRRALAHSPDERYPCAAELWTALHCALRNPDWVREHAQARPAAPAATARPERTHGLLPVIPIPVDAGDSGSAAPLPRRAAVALMVGCAALAISAAGLWKGGPVPPPAEQAASAPAIQALASTERLPATQPAGTSSAPPIAPAPAAAAPAATPPAQADNDGQPSSVQPHAPARTSAMPEATSSGDRHGLGSPALAGQGPSRARLLARPRPGREGPRLAQAASPVTQCRSHEGFMREMCTVLHCAKAEFRPHPVCARLHREGEARLQLAASRGAP